MVDEELEEVGAARAAVLKGKGKKIIFKTKIQDMEEGEWCSRFFFKKVVDTKKVVRSILAGDVEVEGERMMEEVVAFYKELYLEKSVVREEELTEYCKVVEGCLGEEKAAGLIDPVMEKEVE